MTSTFFSESVINQLSPSDLEFFQRIWRTDVAVYQNRLKAIGFEKCDNVLDAGCGFGQWSIALSSLNNFIYSFDNHNGRIAALRELITRMNITNIFPSVQFIHDLSYDNDFFDAIFCYGVIMFSDYTKVIKEFFRILKPGGKVYICANGLGWYLHNLIDTHNSSENFDSRQMAIDTIKATLRFLRSGIYTSPCQIIIPSEDLVSELTRSGFEIIQKGGEGTINLTNQEISPFFKSTYYNEEGVYEVLARKL
jgi:SAM-dependent methyltransferase